MELKAGQIVTVDWRKEPDDPVQDPQAPEPNKLRPAIVVQDTELFDPAYPTVLVVPMTGDPALAIPDLRRQDTHHRRHQVIDHPSRTGAAKPVGRADHRRAELTHSWRERPTGGCSHGRQQRSGTPRRPSANLRNLCAGPS